MEKYLTLLRDDACPHCLLSTNPRLLLLGFQGHFSTLFDTAGNLAKSLWSKETGSIRKNGLGGGGVGGGTQWIAGGTLGRKSLEEKGSNVSKGQQTGSLCIRRNYIIKIHWPLISDLIRIVVNLSESQQHWRGTNAMPLLPPISPPL